MYLPAVLYPNGIYELSCSFEHIVLKPETISKITKAVVDCHTLYNMPLLPNMIEFVSSAAIDKFFYQPSIRYLLVADIIHLIPHPNLVSISVINDITIDCIDPQPNLRELITNLEFTNDLLDKFPKLYKVNETVVREIYQLIPYNCICTESSSCVHECSICFQYCETSIMCCKQLLCKSCCDRWFSESTTCPICRYNFLHN